MPHPSNLSESPAAAAPVNEPPCPSDDLRRLDDCRDFRDALGRFATGVTVLTALTADGEPIGVTISSFNAVSLQPPLILWSLACDSPRLDVFRNAAAYAVNVLAVDQQGISDAFASREDRPFSGLAVRRGLAGVPLIEACTAWFECSHEAHYPGGDHLVFLGRVQRFARGKMAAPLIFHGGRYRALGGDSAP
ncbi:MAG: flavin reductase family protein [Candidatus Accumulibacter sp. UW20]|jgi:flavin reductase (DIM6/NTAB) family NADH-FMN oxidoreductase RutF